MKLPSSFLGRDRFSVKGEIKRRAESNALLPLRDQVGAAVPELNARFLLGTRGSMVFEVTRPTRGAVPQTEVPLSYAEQRFC